MLTDLHTGASESGVSTLRPDAADNVSRTSAEFRTLVTECGVYSLDNRSKILLTGDDRTRWLNGMVTNNVRDLAPAHGLYAFLLNPQGKIQGDFYAFNRGNDKDIALDIERSQAAKLLAIFDHYIVMDDVNVDDASNRITAIGVQGPKARQVLRTAGIEVPELTPLQWTTLTWHSSEITLVRAEAWQGEAYELWLSPENSAALLRALTQAGAALVGPSARRLYRMAAGIPLYGEDIRERDLPQETGQERALHFAKGCYVGQEIVERIRSRGQVHRIFSGFDLTAPCAAGDKVVAEGSGKDVGEITSTATMTLPKGDRIIALGYLRREAFAKPLAVNGAQAQRHELPFQEILQP
jgi:folate-binding protein YgfZ